MKRRTLEQTKSTVSICQVFFRYLAAVLFVMMSSHAHAQETIELPSGQRLQVFMVPPEAGSNEPSPLLILMGGGPGNFSISRDTSRWLGSGFASRGWMVAVPVSPNNRAFRGAENNAFIAELIAELQTREEVADGKVMLAGISNGGLSALEIARRNPSNYFGVIAVPAVSSSAFENRTLDGFPVYLRIGGADELGWMDRFDETVAVLTEAGVDLDAAILDGAPHMFRMDWVSLDAWLTRVTAATQW